MKGLFRILRQVSRRRTSTYVEHVNVNKSVFISSKCHLILSSNFNLCFSTYYNERENDQESVSSALLKDRNLESVGKLLIGDEAKSGIEKSEECISPGLKSLERYNIGDVQVTSFPPSYNFAAYVNDSPSLQELVKLGVNLYEWEKRKGVLGFILQRDFYRDIASYVKFIHEVGVPADMLGHFLTVNPFIMRENLDDLRVRINFLESKNFTQDMISRIVSRNPFWLMFSTQRIDRRLGHFQKTFQLSGQQVRSLAVKNPKLITYNMHHIKTNTFVLKEELGVNDYELKSLLLRKPKLWIINQIRLKNRFEYVHLEMKIPHELIVKNPEILICREFKIKERHLFLKSLKRDQFDPTLEGYVSLKSLVEGSNAEFALNVAKTSVDTFNMFLKTL